MISLEHKKKLFLVDAYAIIFRAYFAFSKNPRINSKGQNTSAAFGFTNALLDIIRNEKPTHLAVVFDPPGGSVSRKEEYPEYKANRDETPEGILSMVQPIKDIISAFNIPIIEVQGFEADDVIGSLSVVAEKAGFITYMMTPDKDFAQLVTKNVFMYRPGRGGNPAEVWGESKVLEKFDIDNVKQVIDILALQGDSADNIPGIPGIGPKTASKLLKQYGSIERIIEHSSELKGKQRENVENFSDQGLMSKMLATIIIDVDVELNEKDMVVSEFNTEKLRNIFIELEFRNLARRILGEEIVVSQTTYTSQKSGQMDLFAEEKLTHEDEKEQIKTIENEKISYHLIDTEKSRKKLIESLMDQRKVSFDTETDRLDALNANIIGISFSFRPNEAFYVSLPYNFIEAKKILQEFCSFFESTKIQKIAHNIKYDIQVINRYGIEVKAPIFDTMIAHYLINPDSKQSMDFLSEYYLKYRPISIESLIGKKGKSQKSMSELPPNEVYEYACEDADITFQLMEIFEPETQKNHLKKLFYEIEMPLVHVLVSMEKEGISIDSKSLKNYSNELGDRLIELERLIKLESGVDFNIDSPKQLGEVLFDRMKISDKIKKTKTGQYATGEDVLKKLKHAHPIIPFILDYRQLRKLKNTYVDPLPNLMDEFDGRIHTNYMQTVTATGRLSSNNPNLQNIPIRSEKGKEIRRAFVPRGKDFKLMAADYSQIELRIIAALSQDTNMIDSFKSGIDIHKATASKVFNVPLKDVTSSQRRSAKAVNFGIIYGQSAFGLAQNLNISRKESKQIIDSYFSQYPTIKSYMDKTIFKARENGYVETIMNRRRYLNDINSANAVVRGYAERNAVNAPIQGSAADIIKLAMIAVHRSMEEKRLKSKMLLQVHDELVFDIHESEIELMLELVKREMESAVNLIVPMEVEIELADNWLDAH
ncbi:MAG: DNA polymerase I [Crocinitomicaceae bacterium]|nr:DNA polymerase I [Crocinitomicaceae bacterium]|tara:strand:+ start:16190 stop:18991 length:2802 start_codon:yes stop_codon:yes gene_type:complete